MGSGGSSLFYFPSLTNQSSPQKMSSDRFFVTCSRTRRPGLNTAPTTAMRSPCCEKRSWTCKDFNNGNCKGVDKVDCILDNHNCYWPAHPWCSRVHIRFMSDLISTINYKLELCFCVLA